LKTGATAVKIGAARTSLQSEAMMEAEHSSASFQLEKKLAIVGENGQLFSHHFSKEN